MCATATGILTQSGMDEILNEGRFRCMSGKKIQSDINEAQSCITLV